MKEFKPIRLSQYSGRNTFSDVTNLGPTEFREITNFDLFSGMNGDDLRTRRGSRLLVPESDPVKLPDNILNKVVFPTTGGEFFIYNVEEDGEGRFYGQQEGGNPFLIGGAIFEITGTASGVISGLVLEGVSADETVYIQIENDLGAYTVRVYSDVGFTTLIASGSTPTSTPLPYSMSLVALPTWHLTWVTMSLPWTWRSITTACTCSLLTGTRSSTIRTEPFTGVLWGLKP